MGVIAETPGFISSGLAVFSFVFLWLLVELYIYFGKRSRRDHHTRVPPVTRKTMRKYDDQDQA